MIGTNKFIYICVELVVNQMSYVIEVIFIIITLKLILMNGIQPIEDEQNKPCDKVSNITFNTEKTSTIITWNPSECAENYSVKLKSSDGLHHDKLESDSLSVVYSNLARCQSYEVRILPIVKGTRVTNLSESKHHVIEPQPPDPPRKPSLKFNPSSTTLTLKSEYNVTNDKYQIKHFNFTCLSNGSELPINGITQRDEFQTTLRNLNPDTNYSCSVSVKNIIGWSSPSPSETFKTDKKLIFTGNAINSTSIRIQLDRNITQGYNATIVITETNGNHSTNYRTLPLGTNSYNITGLAPATNYSIHIVVDLSDNVQEKSITIMVETRPDNGSRLIAITYVTICCASLCVIILLLCILKYYIQNQQKSNRFNQDPRNIAVKHFRTFYWHDNVCLYFDEFNILKKINFDKLTISDGLKYPTKNRYTDILPYDHNRVLLTPNKYCENDYINASYIDGYNRKKKFIATQAPTFEAAYDFWQMIFEKKCQSIVMISQLIETKPFYQYFPNLSQTVTFNDLTITNNKEKHKVFFIKRKLTIKKDSTTRHITQYHFLKWCDNGCLVNEMELFQFIVFIKRKNKSSRPVVVHCSDGAGRTGTFIALDILIEQTKNCRYLNVYETVRELRLQRPKMVQNVEQYLFLYSALDQYLKIM